MTHTKLILSAGLAFSLFGLAVACSETADPAASSSSSGDNTSGSSGGSSGEGKSSSGGSSSGKNGSSSGGKSSSSSGGSSGGSSGSVEDTAVVINEVAPSDDFVELYNPTSDDVDLSGYAVIDLDADTDGPKAADDPDALVFADGTTLAAGAYLVVKAGADASSTDLTPCFEDDEDGPGTCPSAKFGLSKDKADAVFLLDPNGNQVLRVDLPVSSEPDAGAVLADTESWGRSPNATGDFEIRTTRTPGRSND